MSRNPYANAKSYTRWSIRRLSVGVASVVVASGFFVLVGQPVAHADQVTEETTLVTPTAPTAQDEKLPGEAVAVADTLAPVVENASQPTLEAEKVVETPKETEKAEVKAEAEKPVAAEAPKAEVQPVAEPVTTPEQVKAAVVENVKESTDVPASYLEKANVPGPFLAGVNQVIPYEAFGGDGMLTRLLLKSSDGAPWSDNGTAKNPALLPLDNLGHGQYFYEVDLNGNTTGKEGQALLDQLRANGTQAYTATVKVYAAKDGKADLTNLVASRDVNVQLNGVTSPDQVKQAVAENVKDSIDVPASYLEKANVPGPFLAGVNQVIPYEFFGGDGMLTRLLLKASDGAPWSDNGTAKNPALLPLEKLGHGQYFYEVDLNGNTTGKEGQALLDQLRANGTQAYTATVKVYAAKDGKADLTNVVASRMVNIQLNGVTTPAQVQQSVSENIKSSIDVPASYLEKANVPGPFLAGVNQVIPYEFFGGDGMLTRLLLHASDQAPWSDNGTAKNPALLPLEKLGHGQYFYEVALNGNTVGKDGQALLDQLRANGTQAYMATVKVYGSKDGKVDLTNLITSRDVIIQLNGKVTPAGQGSMSTPNQMSKPMMDTGKKSPSHSTQESNMSMTPGMKDHSQMMSPAENMKAADPQMMAEKASKAPMMENKANKMMAKTDKMMLPNTGEASSNFAGLGAAGLMIAGILAGLGLKKKEDN